MMNSNEPKDNVKVKNLASLITSGRSTIALFERGGCPTVPQAVLYGIHTSFEPVMDI